MNLSEFEEWHPLNHLAVKDIAEQGGYGFVYVFRQSSTKELFYIGSTTNLCRRLFGNFIGGVGGGTTQRIHSLLFNEGFIADIEVAWKQVPDYVSEEKRLRQAYLDEKGELPPWNKQL